MLKPLRKRNRRKSAEPAFRLQLPEIDFRRIGAGAAFLSAIGMFVWVLALALDRPVQNVVVEGRFQRVSAVEVEQAVTPFATAGFLSIDLDQVQLALERIDWVDRAQVERSWPGGLKVFITEHVPAARWGTDSLLNTRGELFLSGVRHLPPELPQLDGPEGREAEVAKLYLDTYPRLLALGMRLAKVELDPRGAWELTLSNGVAVRLGRQEVAQRLERFISVASPLVATRAAEIAYVDLRYSNGFSVGWNTDAVPDLRSEGAAGGARTVQRLEGLMPDA